MASRFLGVGISMDNKNFKLTFAFVCRCTSICNSLVGKCPELFDHISMAAAL